MLKPSQERFKFPIRIFDPVELEEVDRISELTYKSPERIIRDYIIGWKRVWVETILDWQSGFQKGVELEDLKRNGFDCTIVTMENGEYYLCDWNMEEFEVEYDKHCKKLLKHSKRLREDEFLEKMEEELAIKELEKQNIKNE